MGRIAPFKPYHQDTIHLSPKLEEEVWNAFESRFVHGLLSGGSRDEAAGELLKKLHDLQPWPNLLFLAPPARMTCCVDLPSHLCSRQTTRWIEEEWPRIRRVYHRADWQFNENAHCLSGVWKTFIEKIANPLLDSAWVEPIDDADGDMCGILALFLPHRAWLDAERIQHQRRAARLAGYLSNARYT